MSKRSGFQVRITAFIVADASDPGEMGRAAKSIEDALILMDEAGFLNVESKSKFMLSKDIPELPPKPSPLDIPTALRRA